MSAAPTDPRAARTMRPPGAADRPGRGPPQGGPRLVTGHGRYVTDLELPRMRHVAFLRSPMAHARITGVDTVGGAARPRRHAVFTGDRLRAAASRCARSRRCRPTSRPTSRCSRTSKVRFAGEPVAAVVAADRYRAEDGARARRGRLRAAAADGVRVGRPAATTPCTTRPRTTCCSSAPSTPATSTTRSPARRVVVERELTTNRHAGNPMECRAGVARWDAADRQADVLVRHPGAAHRPEHDRRAAGPARGQRPGDRAGRRRRVRRQGRALPRGRRAVPDGEGDARGRRSSGSRTASSTCSPPPTPATTAT